MRIFTHIFVNMSSFQFRILAKTNAKKNQKKTKKNQKKPKKTNANLEILKNQKKNQKKPKKNQCQFADFGVATGFFWVSTPPDLRYVTLRYTLKEITRNVHREFIHKQKTWQQPGFQNKQVIKTRSLELFTYHCCPSNISVKLAVIL